MRVPRSSMCSSCQTRVRLTISTVMFRMISMRSSNRTLAVSEEDRSERREVWREAIGVAVATSAYGISFGALAVASGLDVWQTCVLSLLMFTGGSQFAFIGVFS